MPGGGDGACNLPDYNLLPPFYTIHFIIHDGQDHMLMSAITTYGTQNIILFITTPAQGHAFNFSALGLHSCEPAGHCRGTERYPFRQRAGPSATADQVGRRAQYANGRYKERTLDITLADDEQQVNGSISPHLQICITVYVLIHHRS